MADVWAYKNGKGTQAFAQCSGPAKWFAVLIEICSSLNVE
jgi:hypothetical protein